MFEIANFFTNRLFLFLLMLQFLNLLILLIVSFFIYGYMILVVLFTCTNIFFRLCGFGRRLPIFQCKILVWIEVVYNGWGELVITYIHFSLLLVLLNNRLRLLIN